MLSSERCPLDGRVISGSAFIDASILTGESRPVKKSAGDEVLAGSMLLDGELTLAAVRTAGESALGKTIAFMQEALTKKIPAEITADRLMRWLVPAILGLSIITAGYLLYHGTAFDTAMLRALSIMVITCPCTLGIAIPLAKVAFIRRAHDQGIIIQDPGVLEQAASLDTMVFDKTGTITEGVFSLRKTVTEGLIESEALQAGRLGRSTLRPLRGAGTSAPGAQCRADVCRSRKFCRASGSGGYVNGERQGNNDRQQKAAGGSRNILHASAA